MVLTVLVDSRGDFSTGHIGENKYHSGLDQVLAHVLESI